MLLFFRFCLCAVLGYCNKDHALTVQLLDGNRMPIIGLGTFLITFEQVDVAITAALENGYRHIDTAFVYDNEKEIGNALKKWLDDGGERQDLFIVTKLPTQALRPSDVAQVFELSLNDLGLDYIDMYLIHMPFSLQRTPDYKIATNENGSVIVDYTTDLIGVWKEMEKLVRSGKAKSIGVSNFNEEQLLRIWESAEIKPSNLQIENNPYLQQNELVDFAHKLGVVVTAYGPLGSGGIDRVRRKREIDELPPLIKHPVVESIAEKHKKSPAQVLLRFNLQRRIVVIPKSKNPDRIKENIDVFDFELTEEDMKQLRSLDQHGKIRKFHFLTFEGSEKHREYPFLDLIPATRDTV